MKNKTKFGSHASIKDSSYTSRLCTFVILLVCLSTSVFAEGEPATLSVVLTDNVNIGVAYTTLFKVQNNNYISGNPPMQITVYYSLEKDGSLIMESSFSKSVNSFSTASTGSVIFTEPGFYTICGWSNLSNTVCKEVMAIDPATVDCDVSSSISVQNSSFTSGEKVEIKNSLDFHEGSKVPFIIEYWVEDSAGNEVKKKTNTSNTDVKSFTPKVESGSEVFFVKNRIAYLACANSNTNLNSEVQFEVHSVDFISDEDDSIVTNVTIADEQVNQTEPQVQETNHSEESEINFTDVDLPVEDTEVIVNETQEVTIEEINQTENLPVIVNITEELMHNATTDNETVPEQYEEIIQDSDNITNSANLDNVTNTTQNVQCVPIIIYRNITIYQNVTVPAINSPQNLSEALNASQNSSINDLGKIISFYTRSKKYNDTINIYATVKSSIGGVLLLEGPFGERYFDVIESEKNQKFTFNVKVKGGSNKFTLQLFEEDLQSDNKTLFFNLSGGPKLNTTVNTTKNNTAVKINTTIKNATKPCNCAAKNNTNTSNIAKPITIAKSNTTNSVKPIVQNAKNATIWNSKDIISNSTKKPTVTLYESVKDKARKYSVAMCAVAIGVIGSVLVGRKGR